MVRIQSFSKISLYPIELINRKNGIHIYSKKLKTLYFSHHVNYKSFHLTFNSTKNYKNYVSFYHYDNFPLKIIVNKLNLIINKSRNFKLFSKHFSGKFTLWNKVLWNKVLWFEDSIKFLFYNFIKKYVFNLISNLTTH